MTCDGQCDLPPKPLPMHSVGEYNTYGGGNLYGQSRPCGGMPYASRMVASSSYVRMQDSYMR